MTKNDNKPTVLSFEMIGSIVAMLIGVTALFVAWDQAQVMRKQQHASVWPIVDTDLHIDGDEGTRFVNLTVSNAGVGPALIESVRLMINGEHVTTMDKLRESFLPEALDSNIGFGGSGLEGTVIAPGEEVTAMQLVWVRDETVDAAFGQFARSFIGDNAPEMTLDICFCSVFEKCWQTQIESRARAVSTCPAQTGFLRNFVDLSESNDQ